MNKLLEEEGRSHAIIEIYSPHRVDKVTRMWGIMPGMSLDLTIEDPDDGMPWDFRNSNKRAKAERMVAEGRAMLLIGSPMCSAFSQLQALNRHRTPTAVWEEKLRDARNHLRFCAKLYKIQME